MYLVVECTTTSAPRAIGCCRYGEANVLSTTSSASSSWASAASGGDVGDAEQRVGRRLDPDHLGAGRAGSRRGRRPRSETFAGGPVQAPALGDPGEEPVGAAVRVVRDHHVVAGLADRPQQGVLGRQAAGEGQPAPAALQRRQALLERVAGRVAGAAVLVARAAARRRRPARTCWSGRSAAPPTPVRGSGSCPAWMASVSKPYRVISVLHVLKASLPAWRTVCSARSWPASRRRSWWRSTDAFLAFLDTRPVFKGHVLVVPREHV